MKVNAQNVASQYDELASAVLRGEEVEIAFKDRPAIRLRPAMQQNATKKPMSELLGLFAGRLSMSPDFDAPWLNDEIAEEFESGAILPVRQS